MLEVYDEARSGLGASLEQVFTHQVGSAFVATLEQKLGFSSHPSNHLYRTMGNTGPVGAALAVSLAADEGRLRAGPLTMLGGASGLSATCLTMTWHGAVR